MTASIGNWGDGYVTDVPYLPGYYRHQSPVHLNIACLLGGFCGLDLAGTALSYLELGCGRGFGALALAVCNPCWRVTGIDFNPAHIAAARAFATESRYRKHPVHRGRSRHSGGRRPRPRDPGSRRCHSAKP